MQMTLERVSGTGERGGERRPVLAVVTGDCDAEALLRMAGLVASVEARALSVLVVGVRGGLIAPRTAGRREADELRASLAPVLASVTNGHVEVGTFLLQRRSRRQPQRAWQDLAVATREFAAAVVVIPEQLAPTGSEPWHHCAVVTVPHAAARK